MLTAGFKHAAFIKDNSQPFTFWFKSVVSIVYVCF